MTQWSAWSPSEGGSPPWPSSPEQVSLWLAEEPGLKAAREGRPLELNILMFIYEFPSSLHISLFHSSRQEVGPCALSRAVTVKKVRVARRMLAMFLGYVSLGVTCGLKLSRAS